MSVSQETIDDIVEKTMDSLGAILAEEFQGSGTGDMSVGSEMNLRAAIDTFVADWVENNVPAGWPTKDFWAAMVIDQDTCDALGLDNREGTWRWTDLRVQAAARRKLVS